jgi:hypothetical protein
MIRTLAILVDRWHDSPVRRIPVVLGMAAVAAGVAAGPAFGTTRPPLATDAATRNRVVILGPVDVPAAVRIDNVVVVHGDVSIEGDVTGQVFVGNGALTISGSVGGNVTSLGGPVRITSTGHVGGNLTSRDRPVIEPGGSVSGSVRRERFQGFHFGAGSRVAFALAIAVSAFLLGLFLVLFAPRAAEAVDRAGRTSVGPSIGWGFFAILVLPIGAILLAITVLAIPLVIGILLAYPLFFWIGWVWGAWILGRAILRPPRNRVLAVLVGVVILSAAGVVPVLGGLVAFAAAVYGAGAMTVAAYRARRAPVVASGQGVVGAPAPPSIPPPPTETLSS